MFVITNLANYYPRVSYNPIHYQNINYVVFIWIVYFCESIPFFKYSKDMLLMYMKNVQYY